MRKIIGAAALAAGFALSGQAMAGAMVSGFDSNTLARNDDGYTGLVDVGFNFDFYGVTGHEVYVNNNGNVTFTGGLYTYTPFGLVGTGTQIIAPFFADVDTRYAGEPTKYGTGTFDGRDAFGVTWRDVDYFYSDPSNVNRNSFQLIMVDRSDIASGDFDFIFNYDQIQWEAGTASGSDGNGRGGSCAHAGYSNGAAGPANKSYELAGSGVCGAFLDSGTPAVTPGPYELITHRLNSDIDGRYVFQVRGGTVQPPTGVPEPGILALIALSLAAMGFVRRRS